MTISFHFVFSEQQITGIVQGLIFLAAAVFVCLSLRKAIRTNQVVQLKWLVLMAIYTVDEAITYAIDNFYRLTNIDEPDPVNTITDIMDDVTLLAFLWALIVLWQIIRKTPTLLQVPWTRQTETPEGVWPPAPQAK